MMIKSKCILSQRSCQLPSVLFSDGRLCSRSFFAMSPRVSKANTITYITAMLLMLTHYMIDPAKGQCTVQGCENGDAAYGMATEIKEIRNQQDIIITNLQAIDLRLKEQVILNASNQQMKSQQAAGLCSREQVPSFYEFLNTSFQQMKDQHDIVLINLQEIDRRLQEHDAYIKRIEDNHENLNETLQQIKDQQDTAMTIKHPFDRRSQEQIQSILEFFNTSFQELKSQQDITLTSLQAVDRRSQEQVQSIKFLNTSFQQIVNHQETAMTSLRTVERLSLEQSICLSQFKSISEFLNASLQQMQNQQVSAMTSLVAIDRRLNEHDIFVRNKTEIILQLTNALGDWIVIMNRFNGSVNFHLNWIDYRNGFGDKERGEFWLGNEEVHRLTTLLNYKLRIEVQPNASGVWYYAEYTSFSLESENNKYTLRLSGYSGNAGDALTNTNLNADEYHGGMMFSTLESDNDKLNSRNCAQEWSGGWWFNKCCASCLTCPYFGGFTWYWHSGWPTSGFLRAARMMIKSK